MKRILATAILTLGIASTAALADVAVYTGNAVVKSIAGASSSTLAAKSTLVIDLDTNEAVLINLFKIFGQKQVVATDVIAIQSTVVKARNGKESTVFSYASSTEEQVASGTFVGANVTATIKKDEDPATDDVTAVVPKTVKGVASVVTIGEDVDSSAFVTTGGVLKFNGKTTIESNNVVPAEGQSLIEAVTAKIVADLGGTAPE